VISGDLSPSNRTEVLSRILERNSFSDSETLKLFSSGVSSKISSS
jgi:hypothetical protein